MHAKADHYTVHVQLYTHKLYCTHTMYLYGLLGFTQKLLLGDFSTQYNTNHSLKHLTSFHFETDTVLFNSLTVHHFGHIFDGPELQFLHQSTLFHKYMYNVHCMYIQL